MTETEEHVHVFRTVKERVMPERKSEKQPQFLGTGAYFLYKVCECGEKRAIDYKVEIDHE